MKINGINSQNLVNIYGTKKEKGVTKSERINSKDTIEISSLGKTLNSYLLEGAKIDNSSKIEEIKAKIENGTYNIDAKLTSQSIIDVIKGDKV